MFLLFESFSEKDNSPTISPETSCCRWKQAVYSVLGEAQWWQAREAYDAARLALDRASHLAQRVGDADMKLWADLMMSICRLRPDFSQNRQALIQCGQALRGYEKVGDSAGQVQALWLLSVLNTYFGRLTEARAQIERALRLHRRAKMSDQVRLYLLNISVHIYLYAGRPQAGLQVVQEEAKGLLAKHPQVILPIMASCIRTPCARHASRKNSYSFWVGMITNIFITLFVPR